MRRTDRQRRANADHGRLEGLLTQQRVVRAFVRRRVTDPHTVDDLVSETYVVAWRRLEDVPGDHERAVGCLCGVARNLMRNHIRGEAQDRRLVERATTHATARRTAGMSAEHPAGIDRLVAAESWSGLSVNDRRILAWTAAGWSQKRIAQALGLRVGAVAMRLLRARDRLVDHP